MAAFVISRSPSLRACCFAAAPGRIPTCPTETPTSRGSRASRSPAPERARGAVRKAGACLAAARPRTEPPAGSPAGGRRRAGRCRPRRPARPPPAPPSAGLRPGGGVEGAGIAVRQANKGGGLLRGTRKARLLRIGENAAVELVGGFDRAPGRDGWYTPWGGPPDTRSISEDRQSVFVNVHVGGVLR